MPHSLYLILLTFLQIVVINALLDTNSYLILLFSDRTLKVWSLDGLSDDTEQPISLKAKAVVAAHDKDINSLAVAPNDSLVCSGSQVRHCFSSYFQLFFCIIDISVGKRETTEVSKVFYRMHL